MSKVTIIIPTYKRPEMLERALKSVIEQTHQNLEIIVVNDDDEGGKVVDIINKFNDERIVYLKNQRKKGGNGARNTGILNSSGDYITFLDDDDEFTSDRLVKCIKFINKSNYDIICTGYDFEFQNKTIEMPFLKNRINLENYLLGKVSLGSGSNIFIKKIKIDYDDLFWDEELERHQDLELFVRLVSKYKIGYLSKRLLLVNGHNGNPNAEKVERAKKILFKKIEKYIKNINPAVRNYYYAIQYRELAILYGTHGNFGKMGKYLKISLKYKMLNPKKYMRFILIIFDKYFNLNIDECWTKLKYLLLSR